MRELARQFRDLRKDVDVIVPAWSGQSPSLRFVGGMEWLTVQQALVIRGGQADLYVCWTGWPTKVKVTGPVDDVQVVKRGRRYDRMSLGGRRFWIAVESREALAAYLS